MTAPFCIGLIGLGHVGGAFAARVVRDQDRIAEAAGRPVHLEAIAVARPNGRSAPAPLVGAEKLISRGGLDAIVELMGGLEPARTYIYAALRAGRQVVTANKQVIASHGPELAKVGPLRFEAAVASAIPVVEVLAEALGSDRIERLTAILNGTTNMMLEAMTRGTSYADALAAAQAQGLAEADASADVDGHDPAAKLAILAMLAFRRRVDPSHIERVGIRGLDAARLLAARGRGQAVKLIAAAAELDDNQLAADVRPRLVPGDTSMARIDGAANGIAIEAVYAGRLLLQGMGAGPDAAASAVVADVVRAARGAPASAGTILAGLAKRPTTSVVPLGPQNPYPAAS